jgi:hypothetical protein
MLTEAERKSGDVSKKLCIKSVPQAKFARDSRVEGILSDRIPAILPCTEPADRIEGIKWCCAANCASDASCIV